MVTNPLLVIEFIKVINTEILVGLVIAEHEIDGNEEAVFHGADGALFSTPPCQTMVLGFEIAGFGAHRCVRHLGQHCVEVTVGRGGFATAPFASAFMVTRTAARPRGKVFVGGNRLMSIPVSANSALAPRSPTPATASSCSTAARNDGGATAPSRSLTLAISFSRKSYCPSNWCNKKR